MNIDWGGFGGAVTALLVFAVLFLIATIVIMVLYLLTLQRVLKQVSLPNRTMQPGLVWLNLIPVFGAGWLFYTVIKIQESVRAEYASRGIPPRGDFGFGVGMAYAVVNLVSLIIGFIPTNPWYMTPLDWIQLIASLAAFIVWIVYWVKVAELNKDLQATQPVVTYGAAPPYASPGAQPPYPQQYAPQQNVQGNRRTCTSCGAELAATSAYCSQCGSPSASAAPDVSYCGSCGTPNKAGSRFCSGCGESLSE